MEPKFKSSFIPQKPMQQPVARPAVSTNRRPSSPFGFGYIVTLVLFLLAVIASGGVFFYQGYVGKQITSLISDITLKKDPEPATTAELKRFNDRIEAAKELLAQHVAFSGLFGLLERTTLRPVQFTSLSAEFADGSGAPTVLLEGVTIDLDATALQYQTVRDAEGITGVVVTDVNNNEPGRVIFTLEATTDPRLVSFEELLYTLEASGEAAVDTYQPPVEEVAAPIDTVSEPNQ